MRLLHNMAKKRSGFWSKKSFNFTRFFGLKNEDADVAYNPFYNRSRAQRKIFFFSTCDALHLTCFDELPRKKKSPHFAPVENMLYVLQSIFSFQKKLTEILNLGSSFIFKVFEQFYSESFRAE